MVLFWNEFYGFVGIAGFLRFVFRHCQLLGLYSACDLTLLNEDLERVWKMAIAV